MLICCHGIQEYPEAFANPCTQPYFVVREPARGVDAIRENPKIALQRILSWDKAGHQ